MSYNTQTDETQAVSAILAKYHDKRANNAPPLGMNLLQAVQIQNGGYPLWMHKAGYKPVHVMNANQEAALANTGYARNYRKQEYPRSLYRRNMELIRVRVEGTKETEMVPRFTDFVETVVVDSAEAEAALLAKDASWSADVTNLPAVQGAPEEDPKITIARLQERLAAAEGKHEDDGEMTPQEKRKATLARKAEAERLAAEAAAAE